MSNIDPNDLQTLFNDIIRDPFNRDIEWGSDHYPPTGSRASSDVENDYDVLFTNPTSGVDATIDPSLFSGDVKPELVREQTVVNASKFTAIRRIHLNLRYRSSDNGSNSYRTIINETRIGHLNDSYLETINDPVNNDVESGEDANYGLLSDFFEEIKMLVEDIRNDVVEIAETYCHSSCYSDCYSACYTAPPSGECTNPANTSNSYGTFTNGSVLTYPDGYVSRNNSLLVSAADSTVSKINGWYNTYANRDGESFGIGFWRRRADEVSSSKLFDEWMNSYVNDRRAHGDATGQYTKCGYDG